MIDSENESGLAKWNPGYYDKMLNPYRIQNNMKEETSFLSPLSEKVCIINSKSLDHWFSEIVKYFQKYHTFTPEDFLMIKSTFDVFRNLIVFNVKLTVFGGYLTLGGNRKLIQIYLIESH